MATMRRSLALGLFLLAGMLVALQPSSATAGPLALDFTGGAADWCAPGAGPAIPCTVGWAFVVNAPVTVDGLAFWDEGTSDPLQFDHQVGIFNASGTILTSQTVTSASTPLVSTAGGRWFHEAIGPITLAPGNYTIGAFYPDGRFGFDDPFRRNTVASTIPQITYIGTRIGATPSGLALPLVTIAAFEQGLFGPTFTVEAAAPEPSVLTLIVLAFPALGFSRRKRAAN